MECVSLIVVIIQDFHQAFLVLINVHIISLGCGRVEFQLKPQQSSQQLSQQDIPIRHPWNHCQQHQQ